jgi:hypothetical protein
MPNRGFPPCAALAPAALVLAATLLAPVPARAADVDPKQAYDARCARCHDVAKVRGWIEKQPPAARAGYLDNFLKKHFPPDEATRKALAAWLAEPAR